MTVSLHGNIGLCFCSGKAGAGPWVGPAGPGTACHCRVCISVSEPRCDAVAEGGVALPDKQEAQKLASEPSSNHCDDFKPSSLRLEKGLVK